MSALWRKVACALGWHHCVTVERHHAWGRRMRCIHCGQYNWEDVKAKRAR